MSVVDLDKARKERQIRVQKLTRTLQAVEACRTILLPHDDDPAGKLAIYGLELAIEGLASRLRELDLK